MQQTTRTKRRPVPAGGQRHQDQSDVDRIRSMVKNAPINILCADVDGTIVYANPSSVDTLRQIEHLIPIRADEVVGTSMDVFHKNPSHQQNLIRTDSVMPYSTRISLGDETLDLLLTATYDADGEYTGPMVTWEVVTAQLRQEAELAAAQERERASAELLSGEVDRMLSIVRQASEGDLTGEAPEFEVPALQAMGKGFDHLLTRLRESLRQMSGHSSLLASAAEEMSATSESLTTNATETSDRSQSASASSRVVSENVQTVAAGTEEMSASIREIAQNAESAARVAADAVRLAQETNDTVSKLGDSSAEIGQVVKVITSIAQQTNLLALNATIEAARAGEAGKGFAVVANEVKELAKETAKATDDISRRIDAIQADSRDAVSAIEGIGSIIAQIDDIQGTIASAVEEQTATTNEMARNVADASVGAVDIAESIDGVAQRSQSNVDGAREIQGAAQDLARMASELQTLVEGFRFN